MLRLVLLLLPGLSQAVWDHIGELASSSASDCKQQPDIATAGAQPVEDELLDVEL